MEAGPGTYMGEGLAISLRNPLAVPKNLPLVCKIACMCVDRATER